LKGQASFAAISSYGGRFFKSAPGCK
jgi:hypothetical protein